jgi:hypothetical protein
VSHRPFLTASLAAILALSSAVHARADEVLIRNVKEASQTFARRKGEARKAALADFDTAIRLVGKAPGLTPAAQSDKVEALKEARKTFEASGSFPPDDEYVAIEFKYFDAVNKAFVPLIKTVNKAISEGIRTNDKKLEQIGLNLKANLEKQLPGTKLEANSRWHGTLHRPNGSTIPYHLHVGKVGSGGSFRGHVEDNPGVAGNWGYDIEGQTSGLGVEFALTKSTRGDFTAVRANGIISGDRMIAEVAHVVKKKKPGNKVLIVLRRVK